MEKNYTKTIIKYLMLLLMVAVMFPACDEEPTPVLWDELKDISSEIPVIQSVQPDVSTWALIDTIKITGQYFTNDTSSVWVYFNSTKAKIVSLTDNEIQVRTPDLVSDSIVVKVVKRTADKYVSFNYQLKEGVGSYYPFLKEQAPKAITTDKDGNFYVSILIDGLGGGIRKIDKNTLEMSVYAPKGSETNWSGLKFYGSQLFGAKNNRGIWKIDAGAVPPNAPWSGPSQGVDANVYDIDFSQDGMMWAAGVHIYRINPATQQAKKFAVTNASFKSVRVSQGYLYVGGTLAGKEGVWRYQILSADELGPQEEYYILSDQFTSAKVLAVTADAEGRIYVGTDNPDPVITVASDKVGRILYPESLPAKANWFAWPEGNFMYYAKDVSDADALSYIVKVHAGVASAPYYGLNF